MSLIKTCEIHNTVYYKVCSECLHEIAKAEKAEQKANAKKAKLLLQQKVKSSQPKAAVKKVSDKRKELNKEYLKLADQFKKDNPHCKAKVNEYCTKQTEDVHHKRGRNNYLLDVSTFLAVCRSCHAYIEAHPEEAKEKGWSESRLAKFVEPHRI